LDRALLLGEDVARAEVRDEVNEPHIGPRALNLENGGLDPPLVGLAIGEHTAEPCLASRSPTTPRRPGAR